MGLNLNSSNIAENKADSTKDSSKIPGIEQSQIPLKFVRNSSNLARFKTMKIHHTKIIWAKFKNPLFIKNN
jgi:hypothetical protein